jgi:single-stranded DNA-binding protein
MAIQGVLVDRDDYTTQTGNQGTNLIIRYKNGTTRDGRLFSKDVSVSCFGDAQKMAQNIQIGKTVLVMGEVDSKPRQSQSGRPFYATTAKANNVIILEGANAPQQPMAQPAPQPVAQPVAQYPLPQTYQQPMAQQPVAQPMAQPVAPQPAPQQPMAQPQQAAPQPAPVNAATFNQPQQPPAMDVYDEDIPF